MHVARLKPQLEQADMFRDLLTADGVPQESLPKVVNNQTVASQRRSLYSKGGVLFVTSRILTVDLLTRRLLPSTIAGVLVQNAHRVHQTSQEAFILRICR